MDVIKTIAEHAFVASEYPVILSVENHCSLPQQRYMAMVFKEIFGNTLVTQLLNKNGTEMPSPNQLKGRIIIKHKKLTDSAAECSESNHDMINRMAQAINEDNDLDMTNSIKNAILYMQEFPGGEWNPYYFVLTNTNQLYYLEDMEDCNSVTSSNLVTPSISSTSMADDEEEDVDEGQPLLGDGKQGQSSPTNSICDGGSISDDLHFDEPWFHGSLPGGRSQAEKLIKSCPNKVDGLFLVRTSSTFIGDYSLSFWKNSKVHHCRIRMKLLANRKVKYYLIESVTFDTLYYLVTYYQTNSLKSQDLSVVLTEPVPQSATSYADKDWYNETLNKTEAENLLRRVWHDGAYLVRKSEHEEESYSISFRFENKIKHCRIRKEGRLFVVRNQKFENLNDLIGYYQRSPLYK